MLRGIFAAAAAGGMLLLADAALAQPAAAPAPPPAAPAPPAEYPPNDYANQANWLCWPGRDDACAGDLTATVVHADGATGAADPAAILAALAESGLDVRGRARVLHEIPAGPADRKPAGRIPADAGLRGVLLRSPVAQPTRGLFHIGASARPGTGLAFAALSGWHAAELIGPAAR